MIGVGRMGRHHARTYAALPGVELVAVVDADEDRAAEVADAHGGQPFPSVDAMLAALPTPLTPLAASVAVSTKFHEPVATQLLKRGIACLVEKPLAGTKDAAQRLADLAAATGSTLQVGHTERFNPALRALQQYPLTPRFMEVHRISPMTFRSLDIGVVFDMMIHDLDIVLTLARSELQDVQATGVAVLGEHEDIANARLVFANGCVANVTASRLALKTERKMRLFSESAYVSLDYQRRDGIIIRKADNDEALASLRAQVAAGADLSDVDYAGLVEPQELSMDPAQGDPDPLTAQLTAFLQAARNKTKPVVDAAAGVAAVDAAERVVAAIQAHRWADLPGGV